MHARLTRRFFRRDPVTLARALLGQVLVRVLDDGTRLSGRIVEVEAYLGVPDLGAHTAGGRRTKRNESMYGDGGTGYVYFTYGMHHCLNVVAETVGQPTAVLLRALEPLEGIEAMRRHRAGKIPADRLKPRDLCSGPAKLTEAMAIGRDLDGEDMVTSERLFIDASPVVPADRITTTRRIGIGYAGEWAEKPLRFYLTGNPHVSRR
jgi:DNA-3-methyladenine glycosylase